MSDLLNRFWCFTCANQRRDLAVNKRYCSELVGYIPQEVWSFTRTMGCKKYKIDIKTVLIFYGDDTPAPEQL